MGAGAWFRLAQGCACVCAWWRARGGSRGHKPGLRRDSLCSPNLWPQTCTPPLLAPPSDINAKQRRLAEITEMIHTASLVHDDVLDECDTRRGEPRAGTARLACMWRKPRQRSPTAAAFAHTSASKHAQQQLHGLHACRQRCTAPRAAALQALTHVRAYAQARPR